MICSGLWLMWPYLCQTAELWMDSYILNDLSVNALMMTLKHRGNSAFA